MNKYKILTALAVLAFATVAHAAPYPVIAQDVGVCDPNAPTHCLKPAADGSLAVTGGGGGGGQAVYGPTAVGSPAANPPVVVGGTVDGTATGNVSVLQVINGIGQVAIPSGTSITGGSVGLLAGSALIGKVGIDQTTPGTTNGVQVNAALPAGSNVIGHVITDTTSTTAVTQATASNLNAQVQGPGAAGASVSGNPNRTAGVGRSAETNVTNGQATEDFRDLSGKNVTSPYANRENMVRGAASSTSNTAVSLIAAQGASVKTYVTDLECGNTSATTINVTFSDANATVLIVPAGGGFMKPFNIPLVTAANTAFTFTPSVGATTINCNAQGFIGY